MTTSMDIIVTKRLTLRPPLEVDAEAINEQFQNTNITRNLTGVPHPYGLQDAIDWIDRSRNTADGLHYTIHRQRLIGVVSARPVDGKVELGAWMAEEEWDKGYVTEAARALLAVAFRRFDCDEIHSSALEDNAASLRVQEKLGFVEVGEDERPCPTRGPGTFPCKRTLLTRAEFEARFGTLETADAA
ncbi:GNAT family N-acetyltransferase [Pseudahrensia aquimaris]|uniref:GNAT family N-acetyltransferase n=1 Tax=Pseudahrensia aquimaris TaxID=744461 RepID=A0ABW3FDH0_9HYPH